MVVRSIKQQVLWQSNTFSAIPASYELKLNTSGELALYRKKKFSKENEVVWRTGQKVKCASGAKLSVDEHAAMVVKCTDGTVTWTSMFPKKCLSECKTCPPTHALHLKSDSEHQRAPNARKHWCKSNFTNVQGNTQADVHLDVPCPCVSRQSINKTCRCPVLRTGTSLMSSNGFFAFTVGGDGDISVRPVTKPDLSMWSSGTGGFGSPPFELVLLQTGQLRLYARSSIHQNSKKFVAWTSGLAPQTSGEQNRKEVGGCIPHALVMRDSGISEVVDCRGNTMWTTAALSNLPCTPEKVLPWLKYESPQCPDGTESSSLSRPLLLQSGTNNASLNMSNSSSDNHYQGCLRLGGACPRYKFGHADKVCLSGREKQASALYGGEYLSTDEMLHSGDRSAFLKVMSPIVNMSPSNICMNISASNLCMNISACT